MLGVQFNAVKYIHMAEQPISTAFHVTKLKFYSHETVAAQFSFPPRLATTNLLSTLSASYKRKRSICLLWLAYLT